MRSSASRIPSLDGLRAISILLVIIGHAVNHNGWPVLIGVFGVQVFFVLSGFLITRLLQQEYEREGRISLKAFYRRRCFRILPASFFFIGALAWFDPASRSGLVYALTYTVSWRLYQTPRVLWHLWSLSIEEQFYLLWPIGLVLAFRHRKWIAWAAVVAAAIFRLSLVLFASPYYTPYLHFCFPGAVDSIAAGCLLAIYEPRLKSLRWMAEPAIVIALPFVAWTVFCTCWSGTLVVLFGLVPLMLALWTYLLVERRDWILNNPVANALGVLSYSLYLWQQPLTLERKWPLLPSLVALAACALFSYLLIEQPMIQFGKRDAALMRSRDPVVS